MRTQEEEREVKCPNRSLPATLYFPGYSRRPLPGWVVLHGITRTGRKHPNLMRFARALASSGAAVLVPEIPEWRELHLAPQAVAETIRASVLELDGAPITVSGRTAVVGFSFGAPQAIIASTDPTLEGHLRGVVGFGGYCDLERTAQFLFLGEHEWAGEALFREPDPYGRWILGGNYLTHTPGGEEAEDVAQALLALARKAGDLQVGAWEASLDAMKTKLEAEIHPDRRELFRTFAPPAGTIPSPEKVETLAPALAQAMREDTSLAEPTPFLERVRVPVRLIHGWEDKLIPFSETFRLRDRFPVSADVRVHMTGLFAHSYPGGVRGRIQDLKERYLFLRMLSDILSLV